MSDFEICYKFPGGHEKSLFFKKGQFIHEDIDDGEASPLNNMTPIATADGVVPLVDLIKLFDRRAKEIEEKVYMYVMEKLYTLD